MVCAILWSPASRANRQPDSVVMACTIDGVTDNFRFTRWVLYNDTVEWLNNRAAAKRAGITAGDFAGTIITPAAESGGEKTVVLDFKNLSATLTVTHAKKDGTRFETEPRVYKCKDITPGIK